MQQGRPSHMSHHLPRLISRGELGDNLVIQFHHCQGSCEAHKGISAHLEQTNTEDTMVSLPRSGLASFSRIPTSQFQLDL